LATTEYYQQVQAGDADAREYCRLFMIPGCLHCGGGPGAADVDWLSVIVNWVEQGKPPDKLIASKTEHGKVVMTRPLFPFPDYATYKGSGDPNDADSFTPKSPQ
jgi:feruloyl esterase